MAFRIEIENRAKREFGDLPEEARILLADSVDDLQRDPRPPGSKKITGHPGYRIRRGNYRVLYAVDDKLRLIRIYRIGHRRDIYRHLGR